jgi:NAD(P) transhydrogenase subunit alpha
MRELDAGPGRCVIRLGVVRESLAGERRVGVAPSSVVKLTKLGFEVVVERRAGAAAGYDDAQYEEAGAVIEEPGAEPYGSAARADAWGATLIALVYPARNEALVQRLAERRVTVIALDRVPRITRAQSMDVLSSMANLAGYRAVLEAAALYQGFFGPQVTAAGSLPPARVLVIGAGVAGLAAIAAARALGAEVRAFDTRLAAREQVESLGGKFLVLDFEESGEGEGGYAKIMSEEFIEAEMKLFRQQAAEVSVIITTALVPGARAPVLVPRDVVDAMAPGSVIVDLAAEQGGNCELTQPDEVVVHQGVSIVGHTDLVSRMASSASRFFSANVTKLIEILVRDGALALDLEDEIVRGACIVHEGEVLPPPKPPAPTPAAKPRPTHPPPAADARPAQEHVTSPTRRAWGSTLGGAIVVLLLLALGAFGGDVLPPDLLQHMTVFVLACFIGWQVVWSVTPALHTPLMSVTNAISGIIIVGGMLQAGASQQGVASLLGAIAILVAAINISGGFLVTQRMLAMFRRDERDR